MTVKIDIDMPLCCFYCPLAKRSPISHIFYCGLKKEKIDDTSIKLKSCPLKEVK